MSSKATQYCFQFICAGLAPAQEAAEEPRHGVQALRPRDPRRGSSERYIDQPSGIETAIGRPKAQNGCSHDR